MSRGAGVGADPVATLVAKARELGAAMAGIAIVDELKRSPSHRLLERFGTKIDGAYSYAEADHVRAVAWPDGARSALVLAVSHPREKPELDWSSPSGNTPGNQLLMDVAAQVSAWIAETLGARAWPMNYWVEEGGIYMKDAAVLAGLGCIGRNNLLVTPELGPRVRLRVVLLDLELEPTGPVAFDPCAGCDEPCRAACPQRAFDKVVFSADEAGQDELPARDGTFSRSRSFVQMGIDADESGVEREDGFMSDLAPAQGSDAGEGAAAQGAAPAADGAAARAQHGRIKWCRRCELACPVGD